MVNTARVIGFNNLAPEKVSNYYDIKNFVIISFHVMSCHVMILY